MKTRFTYNFIEKAIIGSKAAIDRANKGKNPEYTELSGMLAAHPDFTVRVKDIQKKEGKKTYSKLTFKRMEEYIRTQFSDEKLLNEKLIEFGCFSRSDIAAYLGNDATAASLLRDYLKKGYIERVRPDLYTVISLETHQPVCTRYQIGALLFPDAAISHHSSFEVFGYANQVFHEVYVATGRRFQDFTEKSTVASRSVLGDKLDVIRKISASADRFSNRRNNFLLFHISRNM